MAAYNPLAPQDRLELAAALVLKLQECNFHLEDRPGTKERVYSRTVDGSPGIRVLVYTTVEGKQVREVGDDAIRVVAVYTNKEGQERGIAKAEKRVHRTGEFQAIVDRTYARMREVYALAKQAEKCPSCGAPLFKSKKGNLVCADICWQRRAAA
ncbi:MAG: hypothetical protein A2Y38_19545 [Spirochaetes bacterium GWB1_59_5]|nr:MAG: hypothetical protein A2Y38_19545 [Spirochaetes bacterium GWB1_59_5]